MFAMRESDLTCLPCLSWKVSTVGIFEELHLSYDELGCPTIHLQVNLSKGKSNDISNRWISANGIEYCHDFKYNRKNVEVRLNVDDRVSVPCELRAPEDFLKGRYNLLDVSVMRVVYYGLDSWLFSLWWKTRVVLVSSRLYRHIRKSSGARNSHGPTIVDQYRLL